MLQGDYSRGIPEVEVPKTTGSSLGPANPREVGRGKKEEKERKKDIQRRESARKEIEFKRTQREEKEKQE